MNALRFVLVLLATAFAGAVVPQEPEHRLGHHPAVIVKRLAEKQTYDNAAQHPAWQYVGETPHPTTAHPAVIVARREGQRQAEQAMEAAAIAQGAETTKMH
jgi:hypothetical protein